MIKLHVIYIKQFKTETVEQDNDACLIAKRLECNGVSFYSDFDTCHYLEKVKHPILNITKQTHYKST